MAYLLSSLTQLVSIVFTSFPLISVHHSLRSEQMPRLQLTLDKQRSLVQRALALSAPNTCSLKDSESWQ